jgi:hypothetical protein
MNILDEIYDPSLENSPKSIFASNFFYRQNVKIFREIDKFTDIIIKDQRKPEIRILFKRPKDCTHKIYGLCIVFKDDLHDDVIEDCNTYLLGEPKPNITFYGKPDIRTSEIIFDREIGYDNRFLVFYPQFFPRGKPIFNTFDDVDKLIKEIFRISDYISIPLILPLSKEES